MKKFFATFAVICLFNVGTFAGWIHTTRGYTCDPANSEPGTCVWVETEHRISSDAPAEDSDSLINFIETFFSENNPFDYFLN
jgi:hypothetical protein